MTADPKHVSNTLRGPEMIGDLGMVCVGVFFFFIGLGKVRVSKNEITNENLVRTWGKLFLIGGPIMSLVFIAKAVMRG